MDKEKKQPNIGRFIRALFVFLVLFGLLTGGVVALIDPFYHYHAPILGLKKVLNKCEYQVIGTIDNFDYDAVLFGSSTAECYSNADVLSIAGGSSLIKAVQNGGSIADLTYLADRIFLRSQKENRRITNVYFSLDAYALLASDVSRFADTENLPTYLYDKNPFNDVKYLFNRDVLFEDVPYMLYESFLDDYDENYGFSWAEGKEFSTEWAIRNAGLERSAVEDNKDLEALKPLISGNIALLTDMVKDNPDTEFTFFLPMYSCFFWDNAKRSGYTEAYIYGVGEAISALTAYPNVTFYTFLDEEISLDASHFMDTMHVDPYYNKEMALSMKEGCKSGFGRKLAKEDAAEYTETLQKFAQKAERAAKTYYGEE